MALRHQPFLFTLPGVMVGAAGRPVDSHDGQQDVVADPGTPLGGEQVARRRAEVLARLLGADRRGTDGVDDGLDAVQGGVEPFTGEEVDAEGAADADGVVAVALEERDGAGADVARRSGNRDSHGDPR